MRCRALHGGKRPPAADRGLPGRGDKHRCKIEREREREREREKERGERAERKREEDQ
jgi:hypothetical protein